MHELRHFTAFPRCFDTHAFSNHFTSFDFISIGGISSFHYVRSFVSPRFQTFFYIFCSNDFHVYLLCFTSFFICLFANIYLISFTFSFKLYFIFSKMRFREFSALFCHIRIKYKRGIKRENDYEKRCENECKNHTQRSGNRKNYLNKH